MKERFKVCLILLCIVLLILTNSDVIAGPPPHSNNSIYWVFFRDKGITKESEFLKALEFERLQLSDRVIWRRSKTMGDTVVTLSDLPVYSRYIQILKSNKIKIRHVSRWLNAVSCRLGSEQMKYVREQPFVKSIEPVICYRQRPPLKTVIAENENVLSSTPSSYDDVYDYGESYQQLYQINIPSAHYLGFTGIGVIVCMLDTGFFTAHNSLRDRQIIGEWDFINNDDTTTNQAGDPPEQHYHGTATFSTLGGFAEGVLIGPAFNAAFLLGKTENTAYELPIEEDHWVAGLEWAEINGADIVSSSLGYLDFDDGSGYSYSDMDGITAVTSRAASMAAEHGVLVVNSMGNEGPHPQTLTAPSDAFNILACGAVDENGSIAGFSSRGPTADGRIKPEVVARGVETFCASAQGESDYTKLGGTSLSTPLIAGIAALIFQAHPDWTPYQVRESMMLSADNEKSPDSTYGWGLPDALGAIYSFSPSTNPMDTDHSKRIDGLDLITISRAYNTSEGDDFFNTEFDVDSDGTIDDLEISMVLIYAGQILP